MVQWLKLHAPNAGGLSSILGQGTRSHMLQLKILHATTKTWHSQINELISIVLKKQSMSDTLRLYDFPIPNDIATMVLVSMHLWYSFDILCKGNPYSLFFKKNII